MTFGKLAFVKRLDRHGNVLFLTLGIGKSEVDKRDLGGGVKNWEWIKKGVPVRVEIG